MNKRRSLLLCVLTSVHKENKMATSSSFFEIESDDEYGELFEFEGFTQTEYDEAIEKCDNRDSDYEVDDEDFVLSDVSSDESDDSDADDISDITSTKKRRIDNSRDKSDNAKSEWSDRLIEQPSIRYTKAANTGAQDENYKNLSVFELFSLFFTDYIFSIIVEQTNLYADQCRQNPPKRGAKHMEWHDTSVPELKTWLGLVLVMGIVEKKGRLATYWSTHAATRTPIFSDTMPVKRFLQILRYLHFVDNNDVTVDKSVKTYKVRNIVDYLCKRFRAVYVPAQELSLDETMIKFKGRLSIKNYVKIKPIKWGIKNFTLAESRSGYVLNVSTYIGQRPTTKYSKTTQTVLDVAQNYLNFGHRIFMDNYYMSVELVNALRCKRALCCGTVNSNRTNNPKDMKPKCAAVKNLKRGESLKRTDQHGTLAVTWKDTRIVNLLCNIPGQQGDTNVQRREKKSATQITVPRPNAIGLYNINMGGVDLSDQRVGSYSRHMKSLTWYLQLFFYMVNLCVVQAFILYKKLHPDSKMTQRECHLEVIDALTGGRTYTKSKGKKPEEPRPDDIRFNREQEHAPVKNATASKCQVHTNRVDTIFTCRVCKKRMCPDPCFYRYHYMVDYAFTDPQKAKAAPARKKKC